MAERSSHGEEHFKICTENKSIFSIGHLRTTKNLQFLTILILRILAVLWPISISGTSDSSISLLPPESPVGSQLTHTVQDMHNKFLEFFQLLGDVASP